MITSVSKCSENCNGLRFGNIDSYYNLLANLYSTHCVISSGAPKVSVKVTYPANSTDNNHRPTRTVTAFKSGEKC